MRTRRGKNKKYETYTHYILFSCNHWIRIVRFSCNMGVRKENHMGEIDSICFFVWSPLYWDSSFYD